MRRVRVIAVLLLKKGGLYKSVKFKNFQYVGDPINTVKILNEKEVDELIILDVDATVAGRPPDIRQISHIVSEAFMPVAYGGGITTVDQARTILSEGVEKVVFNSSAIQTPDLIKKSAELFGRSSVVVSIDVKKNWLGKKYVYTLNGSKNTGLDPALWASEAEKLGAGEIFVNSVDRDGTYKGYDLDLVTKLAGVLHIPLVVCGGAGSVGDFASAIKAGASAVAAGSMFIFQRPHNAVLISYPTQQELIEKLYNKI